MAKVASHINGVPSWVDLSTPDPAAAKDFYGQLFGWSYDENPTDDPDTHYVMANKDGSTVAGMMKLTREMIDSGMPPVWSTYVTVDSADDTESKVAPAGGKVLQPAMDVMGAGRMVILADPAGAVICAWEPKASIGAELINEHGAFAWSELTTGDPSQVAPFYTAVFGWSAQAAPMEGMDYTVFHVEGGNTDGIAGAMKPPMEGIPSFWAVYFEVDDTASTFKRAVELGATPMLEPTSADGFGTFAALADPQGAAFSIITSS